MKAKLNALERPEKAGGEIALKLVISKTTV
jgi:hypothetical protein